MLELYRTPDMSRSNYVSKVDPEKCVAFGQCVEVCSMNALKLGQKLCEKTPAPEKSERDLPYDTKWGEDKRNVDYRTNREDVVEAEIDVLREMGVEFKRCVRVFDGNGCFSPVCDENDTLIVKADKVLLSVGQFIVWGSLLDGSKVEMNRNGTAKRQKPVQKDVNSAVLLSSTSTCASAAGSALQGVNLRL